MNLDVSSVCFLGEPAEQVTKALVEQRLEVSLRSAVSVELNKNIVTNGRSEIEPSSYTLGCRHVVPCDFPCFQAWQQATAKSQAERSSDHQ